MRQQTKCSRGSDSGKVILHPYECIVVLWWNNEGLLYGNKSANLHYVVELDHIREQMGYWVQRDKILCFVDCGLLHLVIIIRIQALPTQVMS